VTSEALVVAAFDALTGLGVPFMVSGSLASNFYGVPRATQDADLVLDFDTLPIDALAASLAGTFDVDRQIAFESVTGSPRLIVRARESPFEVELFGLTNDPHDVERFARRRFVDVLERTAALPTAEDVIVTKLRWFATARRRKDFEDARNVIAVQQAAIDWAYVERWCRVLDLGTVLEAARV
jgi:hypothetical protein